MTYMLTHFLLGMTPIDYPLTYVASIRHTNKGEKTAAQETSGTLQAIIIEVNTKCLKFPSIHLNKLHFASFWIWTLQVSEYALDKIDLNDKSFHYWCDFIWYNLT